MSGLCRVFCATVINDTTLFDQTLHHNSGQQTPGALLAPSRLSIHTALYAVPAIASRQMYRKQVT